MFNPVNEAFLTHNLDPTTRHCYTMLPKAHTPDAVVTRVVRDGGEPEHVSAYTGTCSVKRPRPTANPHRFQRIVLFHLLRDLNPCGRGM